MSAGYSVVQWYTSAALGNENCDWKMIWFCQVNYFTLIITI